MTKDKKGEVTLTSSSKPISGLKYQEMSPEVTLVEFISTSAAFHEVKTESVEQLEMDILQVFPNNVMPANAAAWYMAKKRFYNEKLLLLLLKNYPKKFALRNNGVEFLEIYNKEVARKKLNQMIQQGLLAYFTHKVEEHGVYFFDPLYYSSTEPFNTSLVQVTNNKTEHPNELVSSYFSMHEDRFFYREHSQFLVTISREPVKIRTNTTGIIVSMIDDKFGIIQFPVGNSTEKAFFSTKSLFRDGWPYEGDPMKLPPMAFDGYRLPSPRWKVSNGGHASYFTWHAVVVWCGRKPSPRFCSTKKDLEAADHEIVDGKEHSRMAPGVTYEELHHQEKGGCMQVGEVLSIRKNGAVVSMAKDSEDCAFIPGWSHRNDKYPGAFLTTTQGVELAMKDLITFCLDPSQDAQGFKAVGCNVTVLKHEGQKKSNGDSIFGSNHKLLPHGSSSSSGSTLHSLSHLGGGNKKKKNAESRNRTKNGKGDVTSEDEGSRGPKGNRKRREKKPSESRSKDLNRNYVHFLLGAEVDASDVYDSDDDPPFRAPTSHDPELDYDEYSDGELPEEEQELLLKEETEELDVEDLKKKLDESEAAKQEAIKEKMLEEKSVENVGRADRKQYANYAHFLVEADLEASEGYDSDNDPPFRASTSHDPELDYDEYSDGELPEGEPELLLKEEKEDLDVEELRKKLEESEAAEEEEARKVREAASKNKEDEVTEEDEDVVSADNKLVEIVEGVAGKTEKDVDPSKGAAEEKKHD